MYVFRFYLSCLYHTNSSVKVNFIFEVENSFRPVFGKICTFITKYFHTTKEHVLDKKERKKLHEENEKIMREIEVRNIMLHVMSSTCQISVAILVIRPLNSRSMLITVHILCASFHSCADVLSPLHMRYFALV